MWLAYDIGTTSTKAALVAEDGRVVRAASAGYETRSAPGGVMEQDARDWWAAVVTATEELAPGDVEGIALTGQMQDVILLDAAGEPVHPVILYSDTRATAEAAAYTDSVDLDRLRSRTANKQGEGADGLPAKLMWLAEQQPEVLERASHLVFGGGDYVAFRMTGEVATDTTTASTTGLFDMQRRALLGDDLLPSAAAGVVGKVGRIVAGGTEVGVLTSSAAAELGLAAGTPVHLGPGDAGATTLGTDGAVPGKAYAYLGTSGWVAFTSEAVASVDSGSITIAHPVESLHIQIAPLLTAGGNLDVAGQVIGEPDYDTMISRLPDDPVDVIYLPYPNGERSPFVDPLARAAFVGIGPNTDSSVLVRAVLTGVAYGYRHAMEALMVEPVQQLTITGGGTRSELWMQLFADVIGVPLQIAGDAENVGVRGAVIAATGRSEMVSIERVVQPSGKHRGFYDAQYQIFRRLYPALRPIFSDMAALRA